MTKTKLEKCSTGFLIRIFESRKIDVGPQVKRWTMEILAQRPLEEIKIAQQNFKH